MEDTGEDVLRQKPSVVSTFFKRLGQVSNSNNFILVDTKQTGIVRDQFSPEMNLFSDLSNLARSVDASHNFPLGFHSRNDCPISTKNRI